VVVVVVVVVVVCGVAKLHLVVASIHTCVGSQTTHRLRVCLRTLSIRARGDEREYLLGLPDSSPNRSTESTRRRRAKKRNIVVVAGEVVVAVEVGSSECQACNEFKQPCRL
jgi:hypothetical protein